MAGGGAVLLLLLLVVVVLWVGDMGSGVMAECDLLVGDDIPDGNMVGREGDDAENGLGLSVKVESLSDS